MIDLVKSNASFKLPYLNISSLVILDKFYVSCIKSTNGWISVKRMLKYPILLALLTLVLLAKSQKPISTFRTLTLGFQYGDERVYYEQLHFRKIGNRIVGRISYPNTDKVLSSYVELDNYQIKTLNSFLSLAEMYNKKPCEEKSVSSYGLYYKIVKDGDTINIFRFCDWKNLTFCKIKQEIFGPYLSLLKIKKTAKSTEYFKLLKGRWKESAPVEKLPLRSVCNLTKMGADKLTINYVEFISPTKLLLYRKGQYVYYDYSFEFSGRNTYLSLQASKNGQEFIYGHSFLLIKADKTTIKLSRGFP